MTYDPNCECPVWVVGMVSNNVAQLREAVRRYFIVKGVKIRFKRNEPARIRVICKKGCDWLLYASNNSNNEL